MYIAQKWYKSEFIGAVFLTGLMISHSQWIEIGIRVYNSIAENIRMLNQFSFANGYIVSMFILSWLPYLVSM